MTDVNGVYTATRANRVFLSQPNSGYVITPEMIKRAMGIDVKQDELGHDGGGVKKMLFVYGTLKVKNPQGCGFQALT
jgi:hypothetical protein